MKIGKSYLLIFVMSIISFILSVLFVIGSIAAFVFSEELSELIETEAEGVDSLIWVGAVFLMVGTILALAAAIAAAIVTALLGVFGMLCACKNGKFSLGCLIMGAVPALLAAAVIGQNLLYGRFEPLVFGIFVYFGLYTAGAVSALVEKRKGVKC